VAASIDQNESSLLKKLVGDQQAPIGEAATQEEEMEEGRMEVEEKKTRPEAGPYSPGLCLEPSTQEFFRCVNGNRSMRSTEDSDGDFFATPGKPLVFSLFLFNHTRI